MNDKSKTKEQLIAELSELRQKNADLKKSLSSRTSAKTPWESEQKYRLLIENSHDIIYTLSLEGVFTFVSPSWTALLGHEVDQVVGKHFQEFVHAGDIDVCVAFLKKVVKTGQRQSGVEYRVRHIDGSWRWHTSNGAPLRDEAGSIISFEGIASDITERKHAEEALKESQQQFSNIINFLPDATFVIDKEGKVIAWNKAIEEMTGVKASDIVGKSNFEYSLAFYGERRPILIDLVLQPRKDIEAKYVRMERGDEFLEAETRITSFRGKEIFLFGKANILRDSKGNIVGAIESIRDITIRKKAEEALKYSEERFSKAFHMNPVPTIICTIDDGRYVDVNDSFLSMLKYKREDMIGKTPAELATWVSAADQRRIALKLREHGFLQEEKLRVRGSTGEIRDLRASAEIIVLNENKLVLCIFYDITDQEKLESQKRQTQKMEAIGTLAGGIAHDFNNILGAVMGYTEMALGESTADNHLQFYLGQIFMACERASDLVKQILTFSRKSDDKLPLPVQVGPLIKEALKLLRASLPSTIKIHLDIRPGPCTVLADPTQIHQILMNLCTNAAYAMPEKKGELKISLISEEIKNGAPHGLSSGMYVKLTVSDTGVGIDPSLTGRIFDPFFTTKKTGEGTGLGLSVVYGVVKSYGGTITVQSEVGKGTDFSVYLPLFAGTDRLEETQPEEFISGGKEHILFVDDEEMLVELGKSVLTSLGYDVVGKTSSPGALELFRSKPERFDLVITDMTMPNMTGIELAQNLLQLKPDMPVILCTGFSEIVTAEKARSAGVKDLIMKPFKRQQIAESIRRTLDKKNNSSVEEILSCE